jgi:two-component system sensor histidine kinase/response regulator
MNIEQTKTSVILLVDDNPTNLGILVTSLSAEGYKVCVAQDGESAIAQVPYAKPNLILLDVMMPGINGFETCQRLKQNSSTQHIPVIFMTALTEVFDKLQGFQVGAVDYIIKPFDIAEVLIRVKTHLEIQALQNQLRLQNLQLQAEIQERQKAQEAVQVFLHAVSHDLRNPVTGGLMVLNSLLAQAKAGSGNTSISQNVLQRMIQSHDRQLDLINSLLETQANEINGVSLNLQPVNLPHLIEQLAAEWEPIFQTNNTTLQIHIPNHLPAANADPNQIYRVFENLISNALKHNPPGLSLDLILALETGISETIKNPEAVEIALNPKLDQPMICCTIQDNGIGIPPEHCNSMFELYKRGNQTRRTIGLGLGLYLCRQIVTAHGGQIGVNSKLGDGSTFWFTLPTLQDKI